MNQSVQETTCIMMHYDGEVWEVEIVRYANNIVRIFCSFHFFSSRDGEVNDFPTRTQQYSLASPFFPHFDTCQLVLRTMDRTREAEGKRQRNTNDKRERKLQGMAIGNDGLQ